jgi:hypothetical protein
MRVAQVRRGNPNWVKGVSGNAGGRPRVVAEIQDLARQHGAEAIRALVECLKDPKQKVAAATALLDRGFGKPVATHEITHHTDAMRLSDAELTALASAGMAAADDDDEADLSLPVH